MSKARIEDLRFYRAREQPTLTEFVSWLGPGCIDKRQKWRRRREKKAISREIKRFGLPEKCIVGVMDSLKQDGVRYAFCGRTVMTQRQYYCPGCPHFLEMSHDCSGCPGNTPQ